jgi:phage gp36-like protein
MTYAVESDIASELKNIPFNASTSVTSNAVCDFLDQADAQINMYIGKRYVTPVTTASSLLVLKKIAVDIVVYRITKILDLTKSIPIPDKAIPQSITEGTAYKQSIDLLIAIRDGKMDLPDEAEINATSGFASYNTEAAVDNPPVFEKGVDQW